MKSPWSISTTVRNPERLRDFLRILRTLEGENFDNDNQIKYQILLIKERLYRPTKIPLKYKDLFADLRKEITFEIAREVFEYQNYEDPPIRGRQSVNPLNKLGFSIAREREGQIKITELGNLFLSPDTDIGYIFFKSLLKLQFPNPWSKDFSEAKGFNIRPFIAALHLMKKTRGLSKAEFCFFVPTLISFESVTSYAKHVANYRAIRSSREKDRYIERFIRSFYETDRLTRIQVNNLLDYGDNAMRYFRLTKYFRITKRPLGDWIIELEPYRMEEIDQLLAMYDGSASRFESINEYLDYLSDISKPELPWELDYNKLKSVAISLTKITEDDFNKIAPALKAELKAEYEALIGADLNRMSSREMERLINKLRSFRLKIIQISTGRRLKRNLNELRNLVSILEDRKKLREIEPEEFEYTIFEILKIINDEIDIRPNCIFDDEGTPIGFAPGNKADIEGFYESFNAIYEVTLDVSRNQVYRESMPVMRHLREFENKYHGKASYCVFIAPRIHGDTVNYFWYSVKSGYEGKRQKIVAIDLENFLKVTKIFMAVVENKGEFGHQNIKGLLDNIIQEAGRSNSSISWQESVPSQISGWERSLV